jgi:hypothetical protein
MTFAQIAPSLLMRNTRDIDGIDGGRLGEMALLRGLFPSKDDMGLMGPMGCGVSDRF